MKAFSEGSMCPKCGGKILTTKFYERRKIYDSVSGYVPEYMRRTCVTCGYTFKESPLDDGGE